MQALTHSIRRHLLLFFQIIRFEATRFVHYPLDFIMSIVNKFTSVFVVAIFWYVASQFGVGVLDTKLLISYFLIAASLQAVLSIRVASSLLQKIRMGNLNAGLVRPLGVFFFEYARFVGWQVQSYIVAIILAVIGINLIGTPIDVWVVLITVLSAVFINIAFAMMIASVGFYIVEANGIKNTIFHVLALVQGFAIPLFLMPDVVQTFLFLSPFAASLYVPTIAILGQDVESWQVLIGACWAILLMVVARRLWGHALRRYEAIGI